MVSEVVDDITGAKISYKDAVAGKYSEIATPPDIPVAPKLKVSKEGSPAMIFLPAEVEASVELCKWHIVLKFPNFRPDIVKDRELVENKWNLKFKATVSYLNVRNLLLHYQCEEDFHKVMLLENVWIEKQRCRLLKWSSNLYNQESPITIRWVRLPQLPLNFYAPSCLAAIGDQIGGFVRADERTLRKENSLFARISIIELDLSKGVPGKI